MTHLPNRTGSPAAPTRGALTRRNCLAWAGAGLAAPLLQACGGNGPPAPDLAPITPQSASVRWCREAIVAALGNSSTTAVTVALLVDGRTVWSEAFGQANRETGLAANIDTRFNIGSVAKMLATLSVMILRDRGLLTLDQPLVELLPGFRMLSPGYTRITVRHLLSHSSGLPGTNARNVIAFVPIAGYAQDTLDALAQSHLKHEPGELAVYCNDGFTLVEPLVRALTGMNYTDFVQQEIFNPLGMSLSGFPTAPLPEGSFAHPYDKGQRQAQEMLAAHATGSAYSTPNDMMKLARLFLDEGVYDGRRIVSAQSIRDMGVDQSATVRILPSPASFTWGLGWDAVRQEGLAAAGLQAWEKGGDTHYFATRFVVVPQARLAMMISGNGFDYGALALSEGLLLRAAQERGAIRSLPPVIEPAIPPAAASAEALADIAGIYANDEGAFQVLPADDGSWSISRRLGDGSWAPLLDKLRARSDGRWWSDANRTASLRFQTIEGRRYLIRSALSSNGLYWAELPMGEQLRPLATPLPPAWRARLGSRWTCVNESPDSLVRVLGPSTGRIDELKELPGYILWNNQQLLRVVDDATAGMTIKVPGFNGRDLVELRLSPVQGPPGQPDGGEELRIGTMVYRRSAT